MSERKFTVIGISDKNNLDLPPEVLEIINMGKVFSGGRRHRQLTYHLLPKDAIWIDITVPLENVFKTYKNYNDITVFASGDPLFYGYANTLIREFPDAEVMVYPTFNSLQTLSHRLLLPYAEMINVSLTGRDWKNLNIPLIENRELIGVLTDKYKTPSSIARYLLEYGYDNYRIYIGEKLGNEDEKISDMSLEEATRSNFIFPNCIILKMQTPRRRFLGIPEKEFYHLEGRNNMITKMPVRLLSLSMLDLFDKKVLWDIGFCTGSVSIEAKLNFPKLEIIAFEKREESQELLEKNTKKFGAPGIIGVIGDFMEADLTDISNPDAVFIGGHGGKLIEMIEKIKSYLQPKGVIVFNSVKPDNYELFKTGIEKNGMQVVETHNISLDNHNPITIMKAQ